MCILFKTFKTPIGFYAYDANRNVIIKMEKDIWDSLNNIENEIGNDQDFKNMQWYQNNGFLQEVIINEIINPATYYIDEYVKYKVSSIVLQVTQSCNLRCGYCVYSGKYENRVHNEKQMEFGVAKRAIDFLIVHSIEMSSVGIGFYGGEPLLNFMLIVECINYIKDNYSDKVIRYNLTTNGTLLNNSILKFLDENDFTICISLDGPQEMHDRNRKFIGDMGTYDIIMNNIQNIKNNYPNLFRRVSLSSVLSQCYDVVNIKDFFRTNDIINSLPIIMTYENTTNSKNQINYDENVYIAAKMENVKILLCCIGELDESDISNYFLYMKNSIIRDYRSLKCTEGIPNECHPGGQCIAGCRKLFVNTEGTFYPCERCNEESEVMKIGSVYDGFNVDNIKDIINIGKVTEEECKKCWAIQKCNICAARCDSVTSFSKTLKLEECKITKATILDGLLNVCFLKENNFDYESENNSWTEY